MALTKLERRTLDYYVNEAEGCGTEAARLAGSKANANSRAVWASRLLRKPEAREYLAAIQEQNPRVCTKRERLEFYTAVMRGEVTETRMSKVGPYETAPVSARVNAAITLGKLLGDFLESDQDRARPQLRVVFATIEEAEEAAAMDVVEGQVYEPAALGEGMKDTG